MGDLTELALLAGGGDEVALERVIAAVTPLVLMKVRKSIPLANQDDVVQNIWLKLCGSIGSFAGKSGFATWFERVSRNAIADFYREREREGAKIATYHDWHPRSRHVDFESDIEFAEWLGLLPQKYEAIFRLYYVEGRDFRECAAIQGVGYEATRSTYRRALAWCQSHREELGLRP